MNSTTMSRSRRGLFAVAASVALVLSGCGSPGGGGNEATAEGAKLPSRVDLVIPFAEGGGTDVWARFLAPYLEKHAEGNPKFVPENVPGGESITGANQYVRQGGTDGKKVLVTSGSTYLPALLRRKEVQYDFTKMRLLLLNGTSGVIYGSKESGLTKGADLTNPPKPLKYGGISATGADLSLLQAFDLLGVDLDATFGFEGRGPARLALERGEINIDYQTTSAYQTQVEPMVQSGKAVPLMSYGAVDESGNPIRDPNLPDIPTVEEVYEQIHGKKPEGPAYEAYRSVLLASMIYQKGIWANEGTPDSLVKAYSDAAKKIAEDPDFQAKSKDVLGGYPLHPGGEIEDVLLDAFKISDAARAYVIDLLRTKHDTAIE